MDVDELPETTPDEAEAPEPPPADRRERHLSLALAVLLVALVATAGVLWWRQRDDDRTAAVLTSARSAAETFFALDHASIEADLDAMAELATGDFAKAYATERERLAEQVRTKKLTITPSIPESGAAVEYLHDDDAQVLVAVDATTTAESGAAQTAHYRMRVVLAETDGRWLVSALEQVG
ncbi:hypothetical protein KG112_05275 [Nocardioides sp. zg-ZUI104]|uniref:hypothetical protein n=1 Tax=Nocardioides faecalis TaxID=2803858 RepID=UPI001BCE3AB2|nr:hypothetical protein [Nocardioides faecalis]MBS4752218.1 hypothetical protein [Nocardioides faecalis]